jgi:hypothetical protein
MLDEAFDTSLKKRLSHDEVEEEGRYEWRSPELQAGANDSKKDASNTSSYSFHNRKSPPPSRHCREEAQGAG